MKRKLIDYDVFKKINEDSLTAAEKELVEAEDILAKALDIDNLSLHCFGDSKVVYETANNSYLHANYSINKGNLVLENIEELVIDRNSAKTEEKKIITDMLEALLTNNKAKADEYFSNYISLPPVRQTFMEQKEAVTKKKPAKKKDKNELIKHKFGDNISVKKGKLKTAKKKIAEWTKLSENVIGYLNYQIYGPVLNESEVKKDDKDNVVAIKMPTTNVRNENKILTFNWKVLNTDLQIKRAKVKTMSENRHFAQAMAELRKCNAMSDNEALETTLENIIAKWPEVVYLTQTELAEHIATALERLGEKNYDDQMCEFMAEGILRTATKYNTDQVKKIIRIAGAEPVSDEDSIYEQFQKIAHTFFPKLEESTQLETKVFEDLYNNLIEVHKLASEQGNNDISTDAHFYLKELHAVLKQEADPTLELAGEVATWLSDLIETNLVGGDWGVSNDTYVTKVGEHPEMAKKASKGYTPSQDFDPWPDPAPVSDGASYRNGLADEMRNRSWSNWSSDETWPSLNNPYVPKAGEFSMKGEKGADKDGESDLSRWQSKDTWPTLQNPYVPDAVTPKMKSDNLVVDQ